MMEQRLHPLKDSRLKPWLLPVMLAGVTLGLLASAVAPAALSGMRARHAEMFGPPYLSVLAPPKLPPSSAAVAANEPEKSRLPLPPVLTAADADRYRAIFTLQQVGKWEEADKLARDIDDKLLMGHVLADRYLSKEYKAEFSELDRWLNAYGDHPQAYDIYRLAVARRKEGDARLASVEAPPKLRGYGDDNGLGGTGMRGHWSNGLMAWEYGDIGEAVQHFTTMAAAENLSPWERSAASFWAWRGLKRKGDHAEANKYLAQAAQYPRTFYGVLARKLRGEKLSEEANTLPDLTEDHALELYETPAVRRTVALIQAQANPLAEKELRTLFPKSDKPVRVQLLALAQTLDMPAVQLAMAGTLKMNGLVFDSALYPTPGWEPASGFAVDPALVFAFARQESGFHPSAVSSAGALGVMQIMPKTAQYMLKRTSVEDTTRDNLFEPEANLALGQTYLDYLLRSNMVKGNLIYLAAAYNAGPAKIIQWKAEMANIQDPLLFLENIPYNTTRNYVQQVLASYWIYKELNGNETRSAAALAQGQWPRYEADTPALASAL